jgi:hypothetical protein
MAGTTLDIANVAQKETPSKKGVSGVRDLDLGHRVISWVIEWGIELWARSTGSAMTGCSPTSQWNERSSRNG